MTRLRATYQGAYPAMTSGTAVDPVGVDGTHIVQRLAPATKVATM